MKDYIVVVDFSDSIICYYIQPITRTKWRDFRDTDKLKKEIAEILGCTYVDGKNLIKGDKYIAGVYVDDVEFISHNGKAVVINEGNGMSKNEAAEAAKYLQKTDFIKKSLNHIYNWG